MIKSHTGQRTLLIALGAAILALVGFGISRLALGGGSTVQPQTSTAKAAIPPIDAAQPAQIETATFALG